MDLTFRPALDSLRPVHHPKGNASGHKAEAAHAMGGGIMKPSRKINRRSFLGRVAGKARSVATQALRPLPPDNRVRVV